MNTVGRGAAVGAGTPIAASSRPRWHWLRAVVAVLVSLLLVAAVVGFVRLHTFATSTDRPVPVQPPSPLQALSDLRPVKVTVTTPSWTKVRETVTVDTLNSDHRLWRQMHFGDWDKIPAEFRNPGLAAMVRAYAPILEGGPQTWRAMTAAEWDRVPQPIRAMAYLRMIWYWARAEDVGTELGLKPQILAQSIGAIVMAESWFEHRAVNENAWGNRDLGLAQCSDYCRETIAEMAAQGEIGFVPTEAHYFNPWVGARVATIWFERELHRAEGDVDLAIRAYHRGIDAAFDEKGTAYHANVVRLREQYIRTQRASDSWRFLTRVLAPL